MRRTVALGALLLLPGAAPAAAQVECRLAGRPPHPGPCTIAETQAAVRTLKPRTLAIAVLILPPPDRLDSSQENDIKDGSAMVSSSVPEARVRALTAEAGAILEGAARVGLRLREVRRLKLTETRRLVDPGNDGLKAKLARRQQRLLADLRSLEREVGGRANADRVLPLVQAAKQPTPEGKARELEPELRPLIGDADAASVVESAEDVLAQRLEARRLKLALDGGDEKASEEFVDYSILRLDTNAQPDGRNFVAGVDRRRLRRLVAFGRRELCGGEACVVVVLPGFLGRKFTGVSAGYGDHAWVGTAGAVYLGEPDALQLAHELGHVVLQRGAHYVAEGPGPEDEYTTKDPIATNHCLMRDGGQLTSIVGIAKKDPDFMRHLAFSDAKTLNANAEGWGGR